MAGTSFKIRNIAPPDLGRYPEDVRKMYWTWTVEFGIKAKVKDIKAGLDKDGEPFARQLAAKTRKYRKSEMTPSGKGDPGAPPLIPGHMKSRTISLLAGRAFTTHAELFWLFDPFTGDEWGATLKKLARIGYDTIGLGPAALARVKVQAWDRWAKWKAGKYPAQPAVSPAIGAAVGIPQVGSYSMKYATYGIGVEGAEKFGVGVWTGGMTRQESDIYFRGSARATIPGRPAPRVPPHPTTGPQYNRLLAHIHGVGKAGPNAPAPPRPKPPRPAAPVPIVKPLVPARPFREMLDQAIAAVPLERLQYDDKAWIHDVWAAFVALTGDTITLADFKARLVNDPEFRSLMRRADMIGALSRVDVEASQTEYKIGGKVAAEFNFLLRRTKP